MSLIREESEYMHVSVAASSLAIKDAFKVNGKYTDHTLSAPHPKVSTRRRDEQGPP